MLDAARFTVPYAEHTHFVGREEDLARLHVALQGEGPVGINPAALGNPTGVTGQGGIGKTQLAVAYAYRYQNHYPDGIYWLNAAENLRQEFAELGRRFLGGADTAALKRRLYETLRARFSVQEMRQLCADLDVQHEEFPRTLGLSELAREIADYFERRVQLPRLEAAIRQWRGELVEPQAQDDLIAHAFDWLRNHPRSLFILDNLAEPAALDEPLMRDCVPARLPGRVLFTTRRRELGRFRPVELKTLPPDAALALLLRDPRRAPALDPTHPEHATARDICAMFGYLPLALEIAAAHLAKFPTASLATYRDELRRRGALDVMADPRIPVATRYETGLAAALAAQWATLGEKAQLLLRVAGQLPEAAYVPTARLGLLAGVPEEGQSFFDVTLDVALSQLQDASLIEELAGGQARLHPLVREFARDRTPLEQKGAFRGECVRRMLKALGEIKTLERQCDRRGIDALIQDLLAAQNLLADMAGDGTASDLGVYLRVLRREAHNLRGWKQTDAPAFLAQQLHNRLVYNEMPPLFGALPLHLLARPYLNVRWAARRESAALELTLAGHASTVNAVAVTADGRRAVSGADDGTLKVWDLATGREERTLTGHTYMVLAVAVTPDGRQAVSGADDGTLKVWDLATGREERTLTGHTDWVRAVAVTADGRRAVSGADDGTLKVWHLDTGREERTLTGHADWVLAVAVTPDGQRAVSVARDGTLKVWHLDTGREERTIAGHADWVLAVAVTPDGRQAVSGAEDGMLKVWDLATGREERSLTGHASAVNAVAVTPDGRRAVSGARDGTLKVWDLATGREERTLTGHADWVRAVAVTPDGRQAVSGARDRTLKVWDLTTGREERSLTGHTSWVSAVAVAPDARRAVSGAGDGLKVWDLATGQEEWTLTGHAGRVYAVAVTPDARRAVSGAEDGMLKVWDLATGREERTLTGHGGTVYAVAVTPDGRRAVSGADDTTLKVWDLATGREERTLTGHADWVRAVAVTPDGRRAVSGADDGTLKVWDLATGQEERTLTGHAGAVATVAVTPDGQRAVSGAGDRTLKVWDLATGREERTLTGHAGLVPAVAVTPDGRRAVSGAGDATLKVWDLDTGRELAQAAMDASVECVAVAPGRPLTVVAGDAAGNVTCLELIEPE